MTSTEVEAHQATAIVPHVPMRQQIETVKDTLGLSTASDQELELFSKVCESTGLDPFAKQIYGIMRWDRRLRREKLVVQTSIDGFRLIAQRSGEYAGQVGPYWCDANGTWTDVWLSTDYPAAAKVGVLRRGFVEPLYRTARWSSYAQVDKDGTLTRMWENMPDLMLGKCAEALALRAAFPQELSGLYTGDEMGQADSLPAPPAGPPPAPPAPSPQPLGEDRIAKFREYCAGLGVDANIAITAVLPGNGTPLMTSDVPKLKMVADQMAADAAAHKASRARPAGESGSDAHPSDPDSGSESDDGSSPAPAPDSEPTYTPASAKARFFQLVHRRWPDLADKDREAQRKAWMAGQFGVDSLAKLNMQQLIQAGDVMKAELEALEPAEQRSLLDDDIADAELVDDDPSQHIDGDYYS